MEKSIDKTRFEALLEEKRHGELKSILDKVALTLSENNIIDNTVLNTINVQNTKITELIKEAQNSKIEINFEEFAILLEKISQDIINSNNKVVATLENRMLPDNFVLIKNEYGVTQLVKVNYKSAKKIGGN